MMATFIKKWPDGSHTRVNGSVKCMPTKGAFIRIEGFQGSSIVEGYITGIVIKYRAMSCIKVEIENYVALAEDSVEIYLE